MININDLTERFLELLYSYFDSKRIWFVGLQGSYARAEATETSDVDFVVIFDELSESDIEKYNSMLYTLPERALICGFIGGKDELFKWESSDLFHFYYDTKPILGSLDELVPLIDDAAIERSIKIGACNVYHGCVHNMLHEKSAEVLRGLYKSAVFVIRAEAFSRNRKYYRSIDELLENIPREERDIVNTYFFLKNGGKDDFGKMSRGLFRWAKKQIK